MSILSDKVSYLRGLAEGMDLDTGSKEGKLLVQIIDALDLISESFDEVEERCDEMGDMIDSMDSDLTDLLERAEEEDEDFDFDFDDDDDEDDEEDYDFDEEDEECDFHCDYCGGIEEDEEDDSFGMYVGCLCSECSGMFSVAVGDDEDQRYICPHCGKRVHAVPMNCHNVPVAETSDEEEQ